MTKLSMKQTLIDTLSKMSEEDAVTLWATMSGVAEDQLEHCEVLGEQKKLDDENLRILRVAETIELAGNTYMVSLAERE